MRALCASYSHINLRTEPRDLSPLHRRATDVGATDGHGRYVHGVPREVGWWYIPGGMGIPWWVGSIYQGGYPSLIPSRVSLLSYPAGCPSSHTQQGVPHTYSRVYRTHTAGCTDLRVYRPHGVPQGVPTSRCTSGCVTSGFHRDFPRGWSSRYSLGCLTLYHRFLLF